MKKNRKNVGIIIFLCIIAGMIWIIGDAGLLAPDEYNYSNIYGTTQRVSSFMDLKTSLVLFYNNWTGRILVHGILQIFLWLNRNAFYVVNSIVFVIFLVGIIRVFCDRVSVLYLAITLTLIIYGTASFSEKYIWMAGSVNYLWSSCMMVYCLRYFYMGLVEQKMPSKWQSPIYWILAFLTGFSQENIAFVTGSFILVLLFSKWKEFRQLSKKEILYWLVGIACFGAGAMLLIFAPGNFARFHNSDGTGIVKCIYNIAVNLFHIKYLIAVYLILMIWAYRKNKSGLEICKKQIIYVILPCAIAMMPMLIIAEFYARAMMPYETLLIAGCIDVVNNLAENTELKEKVKIIVTTILLVASIAPLLHSTVFCVKYLKPYKQQIAKQAEEQMKAGNTTLVLEQFEQKDNVPDNGIVSKEFFFDPLNNDIRNYYAARYYGAEALYCIPEDECQIEFDTDIEPMGSYTVLDSNGNIVGEQILNAEIPAVPAENRIVFQIPKEKYLQVIYQIPEEIQEHITQVKYREYGKERTIDLGQLKMGE